MRAVARAYSAQARRNAAAQRHLAVEQRRQAAEYRRQLAQASRLERQQYVAAREEEVAAENRELGRQIQELETLLLTGLSAAWRLDFEAMKRPLILPEFDAQGADRPAVEPVWERWTPPSPNFAAKMVPGWQERHQRDVAARRAQFEAAHRQWWEYETARKAWLEQAQANHRQATERLRQEIDEQHQQVDDFKNGYENRDPDLVTEYFSILVEQDALPDAFPSGSRFAYVAESRQIVVERELPPPDVVPTERIFKYVKSKDAMESSPRPAAQLRGLYTSAIAQFALRTLHGVFKSDYASVVDTLVLNCVLETINPATGKPERPCLLTVRTSKDVFFEHDLSRVDPIACLRHLAAEVSANPYEVHPVRPIVDFNMVDPRFVEKQDILSGLESRPNLAELSPFEFEGMITNLFEKMGLETRETRPSRDGGVDCVAWNMNPVVGGKVVVQAKRYKHTVGVSAVRDLFGTVHNEGATKGILVSTSGYGKASYEFADNKPLELITGGQLLYLLEQHSGIEARIEFPDDWQDPAGLTESAPPAPPRVVPEPQSEPVPAQ